MVRLAGSLLGRIGQESLDCFVDCLAASVIHCFGKCSRIDVAAASPVPPGQGFDGR